MTKQQLKTLVLDIETSPLLAYVWELGDQRVKFDQIHTDWHIMAWGAKWLGEKKVIYEDVRGYKSDKYILQSLWNLLNEAQVVITQNGMKFDSRKINARFMLHGMKPPSPYSHIDTYRLLKRVAEFTSHKLAYLTAQLCKSNKKTIHKAFPGFSLWVECLKGNKKAWNEMKKYNIADVLSTEELYFTVKAWAPEYMPRVFNMTDTAHQCGTCGHEGQMREGKMRKAKKYFYRQHQCPKCGAWQRGVKA